MQGALKLFAKLNSGHLSLVDFISILFWSSSAFSFTRVFSYTYNLLSEEVTQYIKLFSSYAIDVMKAGISNFTFYLFIMFIFRSQQLTSEPCRSNPKTIFGNIGFTLLGSSLARVRHKIAFSIKPLYFERSLILRFNVNLT